MAEANNAMCNYLSVPEIFADYWNGAVFGGVQKIQAGDLEAYSGTYYAIPDGKSCKTKSRSRDVIQKVKQGTTYTILGVENQQDISYVMPVRQMEYDVMEYRRQIKEIAAKNRKRAKEQQLKEKNQQEDDIKGSDETVSEVNEQENKDAEVNVKERSEFWRNSGEFLSGFRKDDKLMPVVTTTFYHGLEEYDGCRDLHGMLKLEKEHEDYLDLIPNYPLNLITLKDIQEDNLRTGLREVIGVMKRSRDKDDLLQYYQENQERFHQLDDETINTIGVLINQKDLIKYKDENGGVNMCKAFEDVKTEGRLEGMDLAIKIIKFFRQGMSETEIAAHENVKLEMVNKVLKELS